MTHTSLFSASISLTGIMVCVNSEHPFDIIRDVPRWLGPVSSVYEHTFSNDYPKRIDRTDTKLTIDERITHTKVTT